MSSTQCDYPGCTISAKEKCGICGNIYCIRHIQLTGIIYICDLCIARAIAEKVAEAAREQAERGKAAARRKAETAEALARLEAERPRREAEHKKNVMLASIFGVVTILVLVVIGVIANYNVFLHDPHRPLEAFCNAANANDYQTEYNQLSPEYRSSMSFDSFVRMMQQNQVVGCIGYGEAIGRDTPPWWSLTLNFTCESSCAGRVDVYIVQTDGGMKIDKIDFNS